MFIPGHRENGFTTVYEFCKHKFVTMRFDSWDSWVQIRYMGANKIHGCK